MTEPRDDDRSQARREAAVLLGVDIERLSPADSLRVDMISALRLVIDSEQANVLAGSSADLGKLNVAVQSLIALLPGRELPQPKRDDPYDSNDARQKLWEAYSAMRERGEAFERNQVVPGLQAEIGALKAELAALKGEAPPEPASPMPAGQNVLSLSRPGSQNAPTATPEPSTQDRRTSCDLPPPPPAKPAWEVWLESGGYGGYDRWADNR
jgi:hypothetical protein